MFKDKADLRAHCQTDIHQRIIMSDEGRDWKWRPPPRGSSMETYRLCDSFSETGQCRYGLQCVEAHGTDELHEWRERMNYRRMRLQRAYETEMYGKSYTEEFIEKLIQTTAPDKVMRDSIPEVNDLCSSKLSISISAKNVNHVWMFKLVANNCDLKATALLMDAHRTYFRIIRLQYAVGDDWKDIDILPNGQEWILKSENRPFGESPTYRVAVAFCADIYGTFRQSIVFDFGTQPVLVKHLCVDVIPLTDMEKINEIRKEVLLSSSERWNSANSDIVNFSSELVALVPSYGNTECEWAKTLASSYPCPQSDTFVFSQATIMEKRLTQNNYRSRMHELLYVEEMARYEHIARYNVNTKLMIIHSYLLCPNSTASSTAKYSSCGELFALMHLGKDLSEDTSAGRLILNNCTTILLSPDPPDAQGKVYEALIEDKGKTMIYLRLSAKMVSALGLEADQDVKFNVQFQLNRIPYCEWHYAIDKIPDFKLIFPDTYLEPNIPWTPSRQWSSTLDPRLNLKQKEAIVAITTPLCVHLPPVLIIGPFGTGKTFTLAQAIKQLVSDPENRILICTQSNSAADLYIKDYLHPYVESGHEEARPLRIYYHKRWVATVNQVVQKYCMIDSSPSGRSFRMPTLEDILKYRIVVVTLSISMYLATMELQRGFFTHIFLDEAAQAMECEAIMPLALANHNTRIVLAGDHMQLSPELFSHIAKDRKLHVSLLERLYDHYPSGFPCKILLSENYRAHEAIINFTSESFYDQKLISSGKQPRHEVYYPLTFFTTRGEDVQDINSTAFYNNSEVYEIVERVYELKKQWPSAWGKFDDQSIGIMTPYSDQVLRIRSELRKRQLFGISVERVLNVQGKQFRAIFLSTVRTRRTCKNGDDSDFGFLSNSKLLNTAITRAQSLVAVVGDPVALCSIGKCSKVWERFLQICEENKSLFGITWLSLRNHLDGVELKKTYVLNPLAPEFIPRKFKENYVRAQLIPEINLLIPPPFRIPIIAPNFIQFRPAIPWAFAPPRQFRPVMPQKPPEDIANVQFANSVQQQVPESKPLPLPPQPQQPINPLRDYMSLLPPNTTLADMILNPYNQQRWYFYLLETKGLDAAKKFEYLIQTTTNKDIVKTPPIAVSTVPAAAAAVPQIQPIQAQAPPAPSVTLPPPGFNLPLPLYKRQSVKESTNNVLHHQLEGQPLLMTDRHIQSHHPPPHSPSRILQQFHHQQQPPPPQQQQQMPQAKPPPAHWQQQQQQQQLNVEFANLNLQANANGAASECPDEVLKRNSYASVVRMQKPFDDQDGKLVNGVNSCENVGQVPRLYQYF
ncbi:PREDICTED: probable helicase with zinc finger domain isoform X2 [Nicrophorus vespilloides]|nr:PREDICTED: probable helicase with zinc finger domain isoform X2 [Nicrophorus vespilloides]